MAKSKLQKSYWVVIHGRLGIKGEGNNRTYVAADTLDEHGEKLRFSLSHLEDMQIRYLHEGRGLIMPYNDWLKTPEAKTYHQDQANSETLDQERLDNAAEAAERYRLSKIAANRKAGILPPEEQTESTTENEQEK